MRRLALLPLLALALACTDSNVTGPTTNADPQIAAALSRNPHNPFVGVWWGIDSEDPNNPNDTHLLTIGHENAHGVMPVHLRDRFTFLCDGGGIKSRQMTGRIVAQNVLELSHLWFFCDDGTFYNFDLFGLPPLGYVYDPADETLCYTFLNDIDCDVILTRKKPWND
jgi:hypothetical protein